MARYVDAGRLTIEHGSEIDTVICGCFPAGGRLVWMWRYVAAIVVSERTNQTCRQDVYDLCMMSCIDPKGF